MSDLFVSTPETSVDETKRKDAIEIAVKMLHQQHTRWYQWTIYFFGSVGSVFVVWHQLGQLHIVAPSWVPLLFSTVLSLIWVFVAQNIRAQTRCWDATVFEIESGNTDVAFKTFRNRLEEFDRGRDFLTTIQPWKHETRSSVTRLLILVASLYAIVSVCLTLSVLPFAWISEVNMSWDVFREAATLLATLVTVGIAWAGLMTWRRQLKGKTEYELARRILRAVYRLRDAMTSIRNFYAGVVPDEEIQRHLANDGLSEAAIKKRMKEVSTMDLSYNVRWRPVYESLSDLEVEIREAEVLWGEKAVEAIQPLTTSVRKLNTSIARYLRHEKSHLLSHEESEKLAAIVLQLTDDPAQDSFGMEIRKAVERIEMCTKPYLKL